MATKQNNTDWDLIVKPKSSLLSVNLKEVWRYRDLILLLTKRDITALYKQTVLGPLWMIIQPIFATAIYTFSFSITGGISTDNVPPVVYYLMGLTFWNYFSESLLKTSNTFIANASVFGKVYFPRLVMPISVIISNLVKLFLQIALLMVVYLYYYFTTDTLQPNIYAIIIIPLSIVMLGAFSLSLGIIFSAFTTKYRDLTFLIGFAIQLAMFASCVVFPASLYSEKLQTIFMLNPIVPIMESIKYTLTGRGIFSPYHLLLSFSLITLCMAIGVIVFSRTEKTFIDTV